MAGATFGTGWSSTRSRRADETRWGTDSWRRGASLGGRPGRPWSGQASAGSDAVWTLEGGHGGYCIGYLADPAIALKMVPSSAVRAPAGTGANLPQLLTNTWDQGGAPASPSGFRARSASASISGSASGGRTHWPRRRPNWPAGHRHLGAGGVRRTPITCPGATTYLSRFRDQFLPTSRAAADRIGEDMSSPGSTPTRIHVEGGDPGGQRQPPPAS